MNGSRQWAALLVTLIWLAGCVDEEAQAATPTLMALPRPSVTSIRLPTNTPQPTKTAVFVFTATPTIEPPPTKTPSMTPTITRTPPPSDTPLAAFSALTCPGTLGAQELLTNGSFEAGQHAQEADDVQVPDGWNAFWRPIGTPVTYDKDNHDGYQRPEMRVIPNHAPYDIPARVLEGNQAFMISGDLRVFDAGIFQQVAVQPGTTLCLRGSAEAWSNRYNDNPYISTVDTADDLRNLNIQMGIDPVGGTNPFSLNIAWGSVQHPYDQYSTLNAVQTTAQGGTITVYLRGYAMWRFNHNQMFFDAVSLRTLTP